MVNRVKRGQTTTGEVFAMTQDAKLAFLYHSGDDPEPWIRAFRDCAPDLEMRYLPNIGDASDIVAAMVWRPPPGLLASFPNLKLIHSKGAGIDHVDLGSDFDGCRVPAGMEDCSKVLKITERRCAAATPTPTSARFSSAP